MLLILAAAFQAATPSPSIEQLSWMIGAWDFADRALAGARPYEETGTRSCAWALDRRYIRCESRGTAGGRSRTYVFYLNYNDEQRRFEMLSMWGNTPGKALMIGSLSADGRRLELESQRPYVEPGDEPRRSWAVISYDGVGRYVWESGSAPAAAAQRGPARYRDEAMRRAAG